MLRDKLPIAVIVVLSLATGWIYTFRPAVPLFPVVAVEVPGQLKTTFLFTSRGSAERCNSMTANVAAAIQSTCAGCRLVTRECVSTLNANQREALAADTLPIPSARLPNGVITYSAPDPTLAIAACRESELAAKSNPGGQGVTCYEAGVQRPPLGIALPKGRPSPALALFTLATATFALWLAPYLWLRRRHGPRFPSNTQRHVAAFGLLLADLTGWLAALNLTWILVGEGDARRSVYHLVTVLGILLFALQIRGLYTRRRPFMEELRIGGGIFLISGVTDAAILFLTQTAIPTAEFFTFWCVAALLCLVARVLARWFMDRLGAWQLDTYIIGTGENARDVAAALADQPWLGMRVAGFLAIERDLSEHEMAQYSKAGMEPVINGIRTPLEVEDALAERKHPIVVVAIDGDAGPLHASLVQHLGAHYANLYVVPTLRGLPLYGLEATHFYRHEVLMLNVRNNLARWLPQAVKRCLDVAGASIGLVLLGPLLAYVAWAIRREDGGPVMFSQPRVGKGGKEFAFYKFRSMVQDADVMLNHWKSDNPSLYAEYVANNFKLANDPRVLKTGKWIRRTSIDELPQLWNVLIGDMSLIGPRPLLGRELSDYGANIRYYTQVRPGLTGLWQVSGRSETSFADRSALDAWYVRNWSFGMDIVIFLRTMDVVFRRDGAY